MTLAFAITFIIHFCLHNFKNISRGGGNYNLHYYNHLFSYNIYILVMCLSTNDEQA